MEIRVTIRLFVSGAVLLMALAVSGCSQGPRGGPRLHTSPVIGVVHVDGQPAEMVEVSCHPEGETSKIKYAVSATTDKDGKFKLGTYQGGDGLPEGVYKLTFQWIEVGLASKDKLKGAYADPKKSEWKAMVAGNKGEVVDLGVIDLKSK